MNKNLLEMDNRKNMDILPASISLNDRSSPFLIDKLAYMLPVFRCLNLAWDP